MKIDKLLEKGIPQEIIKTWKDYGYNELLPVQVDAIKKGAFDGNSLLICAPTSSGKTFIGEMAAISYALRGKKTLYLVPFKSIAEEKFLEFSNKYAKPEIGIIVRISDQDHRETDEEIKIGNYDIAILTYEKLTALLVSNAAMLDVCNCVIVDEIHMIMDADRGGNLELLLTKIKALDTNTQIIGLSAVLENLNGFDEWLDAEVVYHRERPVELYIGVLRPDKVFEYRTWNSKIVGEESFQSNTLYDLVKELIEKDEQVIIIRNSVAETINTALYLSRILSGQPAAYRTITRLNDEPETETRNELLKTLQYAVAFHNADCELGERLAVEEGFRIGEIRVIVATTTLSTGVNLPCKTIILADNQKWSMVRGNLQQVNWSVGEVQNIFGRAGRLGQNDEFGRGIFIAENQREYRYIWRAYINAKLEKLQSTFTNKDIAIRVLDVVSTGFGGSRQDISDFIFQTFAAKDWKTPEAKEQISGYVQTGISRCLDAGLFIEKESGTIEATDLGRICAAKQVSIESFQKLVNYLKEIDKIDILDAAFCAANTDEVNKFYYRGVRWNDLEFKRSLLTHLDELSSNIQLVGLIEQFYMQKNSYISQDKAISVAAALLAYDVLNSALTTRDLSKKYNLTASNIRKMCSNLGWILDTMSGIASVVAPQFTTKLYYIGECVTFRVPLICRFLNRIYSVNLSRDEKIRLVEAGFKSEDDFLDKKASDFRGIINPEKADKIIKHINNKRIKDIKYWEGEHKRRLDSIGYDAAIIEDLYIKKGIDLEHAICNLFGSDFVLCKATRISDQRKGEPDLIITFPSGEKMTVQVTAKDDPKKFIDSKKAGDVISQSARFHPDGFICLGRPDFQELAREQAQHHALDKNFKLLPVYVLAELFVQVREGKIDKNDATNFLLNARGYLTIAELNKMRKS